MAKTSARTQEQSEVNCMWGLFSILNSCQGHASPKLISNGRPLKTNVIDYSRKLDQIASFDEECRKIQTEAKNSGSIRVDASERSARNQILADMYIERHRNKQIMLKGQQLTETDSEFIDRLVKSQKAARRKKSQRAYQSSLSHVDDEKIMQQAKMSVKAFIDQMFVDGKFVSKLAEPNKPFSDALQVLSTNSVLVSKCERVDYQHRMAELPSDKIVILKPMMLQNGNKEAVKKMSKPDIACSTETVRKKIDFSSATRLSKKREVNVDLEAKRHLFERLNFLNAIGALTGKRSPKSLWTILSSHERDLLSPNGRQRTCLIRSTDEGAHDLDISATGNMRSNGELNIVEMKNICHSEVASETNRTDVISSKLMHPILDSFSENETFTCTVDDLSSTPTSVYELNMPENIIKHQEEHQSPVSVLEQFLTEDANSPSNIMLQTERKRLQPLRLRFEECSVESSPQDPPISANAYIDEQDYISQYVHLVLQASCLNWDQLSKIKPQSEELLHASLFDEVDFLPSDCHFDPKILFDHMNEVLLEIRRSHFCSPPLPSFVKRKNCSVPLEELVLDEIMREADFYLLPTTEERTLDEIVANDVADSRSWIDVRTEAEHVMIHISEDILEESVLDVVLGFHS
ncbi:hypothetical protein DH2020_036198 [Rehmannia glutinosa]|uniref:DUF4378 domain-containing protein n=1 Tax=Rehmannia glutinosa TaxID=99300 RepID=A0ABR0V571_REHGL